MNITNFAEPPEKPRKTALQKLQEELQRQSAPFRHFQEMQGLVKRYSPDYQMHDLFKQFDVQLHQARDQTLITKQFQNMLDQTSISNQAQKLYDQYFPKTAFPNLSVGEKEYQKYFASISDQQDFLGKISLAGISIQDYAKHLEQANPAFAAIEAAKKQMDTMLGSFPHIDLSAFEGVGDEEREEAQGAATFISQTATAEPTLQGAVEKILAAIAAQKKPAVQAVLLLFFLKVLEWIAQGAIGAVMSHFSPLVLGESPQAATKHVKEVARQLMPATDLLTDYRFVSAKLLIVRQNSRARSPEIARLTFGQPVRLLRKEKNFALVVWSDKEAGVEIQGWVFARYLSKFN